MLFQAQIVVLIQMVSMVLIWTERMKTPRPVGVPLLKPWPLRQMNRTSRWYKFGRIR